MSPSKSHQVTYPALISSDVCHFIASDEVKSSMFPFSSPTANIRLVKMSAHPSQGIQGTTNSFDTSEGANATAVAASGSLMSATAVHLVRLLSRGCHILTCLHGFALTPPVVHVTAKTTQPSYPEMRSRRPSRRPPKPHPRLSEHVTCLLRSAHILHTKLFSCVSEK
jgi:hypothetical protein